MRRGLAIFLSVLLSVIPAVSAYGAAFTDVETESAAYTEAENTDFIGK